MNENLTPTQVPIEPPVRWLTWLLLGILSVFFAEVCGASSPLVFLDIFGLLVTVPLFALQLLVLAPLAIRRGIKPGLNTLILAGALFGLHEAYITKVLWLPPWNPEALRVGGIALLETLVLVLLWHPFMALILPLLTGSRFFGDNDTLTVSLQGKWMKRLGTRWPLIPGAILGILQGAAIGDFRLSLLSTISSTLLIALLIALWMRTAQRRRFNLADLLPNRSEWRIFALLLLVDYLVLGYVLRREAFPGLVGHITIWLLYALLGGLFWLSRRADQKRSAARTQPFEPVPEPGLSFNLIGWLWFSLAFIVLAALSALLLGWVTNAIYLVLWAIAIPAGLLALGRLVRKIIKKRGESLDSQSKGSRPIHPS